MTAEDRRTTASRGMPWDGPPFPDGVISAEDRARLVGRYYAGETPTGLHANLDITIRGSYIIEMEITH